MGALKTPPPQECWWEIFIRLTSQGTYALEEAKTSYSGHYKYSIQWTGCMELDGEDFILYHEDSDLTQWEPQEKKRQAGSSDIEITRKFLDKPCFVLNYILTKEENIHFDFLVRGFRVPQQGRGPKYCLHLPASRENSSHPTDITYDLHITKGSNQVFFSKDDLLDESAKKDFHWSWKRHSSKNGGGQSSYLSHSYKVDVDIAILRHLKK